MDPSAEWTTAHDLALIYCGLACVDRDLTDDEVTAIEEPLQQWVPLSADTTTGEVVQEAAQALRQSQKELRRSIQRVGESLSPEECRTTLEHLLRIAQADGVLIESERQLIHSLATTWDLKRLHSSEREVASDTERAGADWTLLHEIAFLFVQVGHAAEEGLGSGLLGVMAERLHEWRPADTDDEVRAVLRRALQAFAEREEEPLLQDSVATLRETLSSVQRLIVLDDLHAIARTGGTLTSAQRRHLQTLAEAWGINVRVDGA